MVIRILTVIVLFGISAFAVHAFSKSDPIVVSGVPIVKPTIEEVPTPISIPEKKVLNTDYHIFQSFNNCGPASLSMALSYYGIKESQETLGQELRPWQNPDGIHDDKSVTLTEMAEKAKDYDLIPYHRPNGNIEIMQQFIAAGMPVVTRTWLHADEDIGHYRIVKGYDSRAKTLIQDDSFQDKNLTYTYNEFNEIWEKFNYEYLVLVPRDKQRLAEAILGKNVKEQYAWEQAKQNSLQLLMENPENMYNRFNLSVAYYHLGDFQKSVEEFEKVETQLPFRTLWYQIEPIQAYYELKNYDRVFAISDSILNNQNSAFSELYLIRGNSYKQQGTMDAARAEYEKALFYNQNFKAADEALTKL